MLSTSITAAVVLVNERDEPTGTMEKLEAHEKGLLHRAFSVFITNAAGEMLLQQRAAGKYHCGGLWTNTCCSHPYPGEKVEAAAHRRLQEEMGFDCALKEVFSFTYKAKFDNGLTEHEFDHVLIGNWDGKVIPNPDEVGDYRYLSFEAIQQWLAREPQLFTPWFHLAFSKVTSLLSK